jgi:VWFA-related protein
VAGWLPADELADEPAATFFEPYKVPLVSVEVVVTDQDGNAIRGLTREDFQVFEDGAPVEISHFFVSDPEVEVVDLASFQDDLPENFRQELYLALYFDDSNIDYQRRVSALNHLRDFLEKPLPSNVKAMLLRYDGSPHVESSFTDDTAQLVAAVERVMDEASVTGARGGEALVRRMQTVAESPRHELTSPMAGGGSPGTPQRFVNADPVDLKHIEHSAFLPEIRAYAESQYARNRASLEALDWFVNRMRVIRGRKAVVWVGDLEMRAGENIFRTWMDLFSEQSGRQHINPMMETMQYDLSREIRELVDRANNDRISFYTLSAPITNMAGSTASSNRRILTSSGRPGQQGSQDIRGHDDALLVMSDLSGGRMLSDNNQLDQQLVQVSEELETYYSLGYTPPTPGDGEQHDIKVTVNRDGVRLRHRLSYRDSEPSDGTADRTLVAGMLGVAENPFGITLECQEQEAREDGNFLVPIMIRIPIGELVLLPEEGRHQAQISVYSVIFDEAGRSSKVHERAYPIEIENDQLLSAVEQEAKFVVGVVLEQGPHRIAVTVRDDRSSSESTAVVDVAVGDTEVAE